jgi:hypothetical protein
MNHKTLDLLTEKEKIGKKVNHFSHPFGTPNEVGKREIEFVKKCEFDTACYSFGGDVNTKNINKLHELSRVFFGELHH